MDMKNHITKKIIGFEDKGYPVSLKKNLGEDAPEKITALGELSILETPLLALFSSVKCPGDLILMTYDLAIELRDKGVTVIGGFHSPMERDCLDILLKGNQPVVICPARGIQRMRMRKEWREPLDHGQLLILSPFGQNQNRITVNLAEQRNFFAAALATTIFIAHAGSNSKTLSLAHTSLSWIKPVYTFEHPANSALKDIGVSSIMKFTEI